MTGSPPRNAILAILLALALIPGLWLVDRTTQSCGDGLCGFLPGLLVIGALLAATLVFVMRGLNRNEQPRWLFVVPWIVWLVVAKPLFF